MYDLIVIGAGPGGYSCAVQAAKNKMKVLLIEKDGFPGGTCLNVGCIPSKTLLHFSHLYFLFQKYGSLLGCTHLEKCSWKEILEKKDEVINLFRKSLTHLFSQLGIETIQGEAELTSPNEVVVSNKRYKSRFIVLAAGSTPIEIPNFPFDEKVILSSTGALSLKEIPKKMVVIGGGVIGVELASVYQRFGSKVTIVEMLPEIIPGLDAAIQKGLRNSLKTQGIEFYLSSKAKSCIRTNNGVTVELETGQKLESDVVLVAVGRKPLISNLDKLGISLTPSKHIAVDSCFRTTVSSIFAIGDLIEGPMLAHRAQEEGVSVAEFISGRSSPVNAMIIPNVIYTSPEVATVGFSEEEAKALGISFKVGISQFRANPRAHCTNSLDGFVKIIVESNTRIIIGLHILGDQASEMIAFGQLAILKRVDVSEIASLPIAHPTLSESIKEAAQDLV